jgi:hypothetical protein
MRELAIDLRCGNMSMTQQGLDSAQFHTPIEHKNGK